MALTKTVQLRKISHMGGRGSAIKPKIKGKSHTIRATSFRVRKKRKKEKQDSEVLRVADSLNS